MRNQRIKNTILAFTVAGMITVGGSASQAALGDRTLSLGTSHPDVKELQEELRKGNYFTFKNNTSYYGSITRDAVIKFQRAKGLTADGIFGKSSYEALKGNTSAKVSKSSKASSSSLGLSYSGALRQGAKGSQVASLQRALKQLGHYNRDIDSSFGPATKTAVLSFQKASKIPVDGSAGPLTRKTINSALGVETTAKSANPPVALTHGGALRQGARGSHVANLQKALKQLGHYKHDIDSSFGKATRTAVLSFQKANNIPVDGSAGPLTRKTINSVQGVEAPAEKTTSSGALTHSGALRQGARGSHVRNLQNALKKLGHHTGSVDGIFGGGTRSSVLSFQRSQNIPVDGSAGPLTTKTINGVLNGNIKAGKVSKAPNRGNSNTSLVSSIVNTAKNHIGGRYVYGGTGPSGFDCSGFTQYVYRQAGISIPRTTGSQANAGSRVSRSQLQVGDLLIFSNTYRNGPSHAGVYIGSGQFVHASNPRTGIRVDSINSSYYRSKFSYGRRVF